MTTPADLENAACIAVTYPDGRHGYLTGAQAAGAKPVPASGPDEGEVPDGDRPQPPMG